MNISFGYAASVPVDAAATQDDDLLARLRAVAPSSEAIHDPAGRGWASGAGEPPRAWTARYPVVVFLTSLEPVREAMAAGRAVEVPAAVGKAVLLRNLTEEELERYHALAEFRGSFNYFVGDDEDAPPSPANYGLYVYRHLTDNWISGPYGRQMIPGQPLHIDQLPHALRASLGALRLENVRFAQAPLIQPVEHVPCASWESGWLDVNFKRIRPIPGREAEYAEHYEDYYSDTPYESEPPAEAE
jgi:hypothetical protein